MAAVENQVTQFRAAEVPKEVQVLDKGFYRSAVDRIEGEIRKADNMLADYHQQMQRISDSSRGVELTRNRLISLRDGARAAIRAIEDSE